MVARETEGNNSDVQGHAAGEGKQVRHQMVISSNPFDVLNNNIHVQSVVEHVNTQPKHKEQDDEIFLSVLKKARAGLSLSKSARKVGIFRKIRIFSKNEIHIPIKKYYKFPFDQNFKNDGTSIFDQISKEIVISLASVYSNYRKFNESFKVVYNGEIIYFEDRVRVSSGLERLLKQNDIQYIGQSDALVVDDSDVALVYDMLMNVEIGRGYCLPFIFSEYEFDNAIVYHTRIEKGPIVSIGAKIEYLFFVHGPLFSLDYCLENATEIEYEE